MPLANPMRGIPSSFQVAGDELVVCWHRPWVGGGDPVVDTMVYRVPPAEEAGPSGRAEALYVVVVQDDPSICKLVNRGRIDLAACKAQIMAAQVVHDDHNDMRLHIA